MATYTISDEKDAPGCIEANGADIMALEDFRDAYVNRVLELLNKNVDMAAGTLGMTPENLRGWISHA